MVRRNFSSLEINKKNSNSPHELFKILIIDDDINFQKSLSFNLQQSYKGIKIVNAESGEIGLNYIKENGFHLIIIDLIMPTMDGAEVLRNIRKLKRDYKIIVLTAFAKDEILKQIEKEQPNEIFDKADFDIDKLMPYIEVSRKG